MRRTTIHLRVPLHTRSGRLLRVHEQRVNVEVNRLAWRGYEEIEATIPLRLRVGRRAYPLTLTLPLGGSLPSGAITYVHRPVTIEPDTVEETEVRRAASGDIAAVAKAVYRA